MNRQEPPGESGPLRARIAELEMETARLQDENARLRIQCARAPFQSDGPVPDLGASVIEAATDGILHVDQHTRKILHANTGMSRLTGYTVPELLTLSVDDIHPPANLQEVLDKFDALLAGAVELAVDVPVLRRDRAIIYCDITAGFSRVGDQGVFFGVFRDITERRRREDDLSIERQRFESLAENAPFAIAMISRDGKFLYINEVFRTMFGYDLREIPDGRTWFRKAFPDLDYRREVVSAWIEDNQDSECGERRPRIFEVTCKDGSKKLTHFRPVRLVTGEHTMTCEDITERRRVETALRESEAMFRLLTEQSLMSVAILQDGVYHYANEAMAELVGYSADAILCWGPEEFLERAHPEDRDLVRNQARMKQQGDPRQQVKYEFRILPKSGGIKWVEIYSKTVDYRGRSANLLTMVDITERKHAENELNKAQALLEAAIEQSPAGILIADAPDVRVRVANSAALGIRGEAGPLLTDIPAELHPQRWQTYHPDGTPFDSEDLPLSRAVLFGETSRNVEAIIRNANGEDRRVFANAAPVRNKDGEIIAGVVVFADFTDRLKAEDALRESEQMLKTILAASPAAITCVQEGVIQWTNPAMVSMFGLHESDEALGTAAKDYYSSEAEYQRVRRLFRHCAASRVPFSGEAAFRRKDGAKFTGELRVSPFPGSGRRGLISAIVDVSDRVTAQEALRGERENYRRLYEESKKQYELYRSLLDSSADAVVIYDLEGRVQYVNDSFTRIFGWTVDELTGLKPPFLPDSEKEASFERINRLIRFGEACSGFETKRFTKDGRLLEISLSASRFHDHEGAPAGMLVVLADITERKNLEAQLRHSAKMEAIGQLAGGVAHDFNNILTAVIGYSNLVERELGDNTRHREKLRQIIRAAERAAELTKQLLAFGRKQMLDMKVVRLNQVIEDIGDLLKRLIGEKIELRIAADPDAGNIRADETQVQQILMNLIINARDAAGLRGKITVETANVILDEPYIVSHPEAVPGHYVMFAVSDNGIGMTPETASKIFEPFFTTKDKGQGTGLGLATVYGIVKQHGGHICVYSEPGRGAAFKVYLPRVFSVENRTPQTKPDAMAQTTGEETILVVEDEEVVRRLAVEALTLLGYRTLAAADPREALELCDNYPGPIDMVITDVVLPGMDGKSLFEALSAKRASLRVLFVSGYTENFIVHQGILDRDVNFLPKPFSLEGLARKTREILDSG